jgi:gas vesicle protein
MKVMRVATTQAQDPLAILEQRLRVEAENFKSNELEKPVTEGREYSFTFDQAQSIQGQWETFQQQLDLDYEQDADALERRNDREHRLFNEYQNKLETGIRYEERLEFAQQDKQYEWTKNVEGEWERHKEAQEWESNRRQELRDQFYKQERTDFVREQSERHLQRLETLNERNSENVQQLESAYEQAIEQHRESAPAQLKRADTELVNALEMLEIERAKVREAENENERD